MSPEKKKRRLLLVTIAALTSIAVAAAVLPLMRPPHICRASNLCIANLKQLQGAKDCWALNHNKLDDNIPIWKDLIGPDGYIRDMPVCPEGGTYTLGKVGESPRCTLPEHVLP